MERTIKNRFIQIQGKENISDELDYGEDVTVVVSVIEKVYQDNQDGTVDEVCKAKLLPMG